MALQAFIDDSFDAQTGLYVLAGYISTVQQWTAFSSEWERMLSHGSLRPDGERQFKMSEMAISGDRMSKVPWFHAIINRHVIMSLSVYLRLDDIERAIARLRAPIGQHVLHDTRPFVVAYNFMMTVFHRTRLEGQVPQLNIDVPVSFTFDESAEKNAIIAG